MSKRKSEFNHFCGRCVRAVCADCQSIAEEALELSARRGQMLYEAEHELKLAREERDAALRRAADWERLAKLGVHPLIIAWIENHRLEEIVRLTAEESRRAQEIEPLVAPD